MTAPISPELTDSTAAQDLIAFGDSPLAVALRRAKESDDDARSQHHSYNSHSSNPW